MDDSNSARLPAPQGLSLVRGTDAEVAAARHLPYQSVIGSLMWAAICTRPDVSHVVGQLSKFNSCYTLAHWAAAKHLLCYIWGSLDVGITYTRTPSPTLLGYADADYANDRDSRRSVTGYLFCYGGSAISWRSHV